MANRDKIVQELAELGSGLANSYPENVFRVPAGYFDNLASLVLKRVRAEQTDNMEEELELLSPVLAAISRQIPYEVPSGYFAGLEKKLEIIIAEHSDQTVLEELETLSPLLAGLKNKDTYTVPPGYFETQKAAPVIPAKKEEAKVISIGQSKWFRYAAAAMVIGVVTTVGWFLLNNGGKSDQPSDKSFAWVKKNMKKVSTDDITEFVELAGAGTIDLVKSEKRDEIMNSLLKDVSDKEIQDFLNETQITEPEPEDDLILN